MKITQKLLLTVIVLVIGFVVIGLVSRQVLLIEEQAFERNAATNEFARLAQKVQIDLQRARNQFASFQMNDSLIALEGFENAISEAREDLAKLQVLSTDRAEAASELAEGMVDAGGMTELLAGLTEQTNAFHEEAYATAELQITLGLDQDSGLQGDLRENIHEVESLLVGENEQGQASSAGGDLQAKLAREQLRASMLQIRRYEKDFLQRGDTEYIDKLLQEQETFALIMEEARMPEASVQEIAADMTAYTDVFGDIVDTVEQLQEAAIRMDGLSEAIPTLVESVVANAGNELQASNLLSEEQTTNATRLFIGTLAVVGVIVVGVLLLLSSGISRTLAVLQSTVRRVTEGDTDARSQLTGSDELHTLGRAFDGLLDERMATLVAAQSENEQLNDSIIELLQAVAQLSQRDLTVKVPVSEDIIGPVADSLNLFTDETAKVLRRVTSISADVAAASNTVKGQSDTVMVLAEDERQQVVRTSAELAEAAEAMNEIAELAQVGNRAADEAIGKTRAALETVTNTVSGINATRDTIRETEKRIKRLGERSQEITGAVNLINNIAERTHILALNASMHAASAGEAGRGFAVVADEVQRLAENARQATEQISNLVSNIQTETQDTVATMNTAISQVVDGSRLAEQAGERMRETQDSTTALVASVQRIAESSQTQAQVSNALRGRARQIEESTEKTSRQLEEQGVQTGKLLGYADHLLDAVRIFKLPAGEEDAAPVVEEGLKLVSDAEPATPESEQRVA